MPTIEGTYRGRNWRLSASYRPMGRSIQVQCQEGYGNFLIELTNFNECSSMTELLDRIQVDIARVNILAGASDIDAAVMIRELPLVSRTRIARLVLEEIPGVAETDECQCLSCRRARTRDDIRGNPYPVIIARCDNCGVELYSEGQCYRHSTLIGWGNGEAVMCATCQEDEVAYCTECERDIWTPNTAYNWDYEQCYDCRNRFANVIRSWNYRPELNFHPLPPENGGTLYIGMELEVSFDVSQNGRKWAAEHLHDHEDLLYCKEDSSVNSGFEVVTHPMQPDWAMENFPFQAFQKGIEGYGLKLTDGSTGTHIHMNKEAFSPAHLWKFLQIHMKLPDFCGTVGGRGTDAGYGSFRRNGGNFLGVDRRTLLEIAKKKGKWDNPERYIAVNLRNEYTLELRYMRGGSAPKEIKKNIQWAKALYDFSNYIDVRDVREGALENPGYLLWWIGEHKEELFHLYDWIQTRIPQPTALRERSN